MPRPLPRDFFWKEREREERAAGPRRRRELTAQAEYDGLWPWEEEEENVEPNATAD
jgi:hypothetical protein